MLESWHGSSSALQARNRLAVAIVCKNHQVRIGIFNFSLLQNLWTQKSVFIYLPVIFCMRLAHVKPVAHHHRTPYYDLGPEAMRLSEKPFNSSTKNTISPASSILKQLKATHSFHRESMIDNKWKTTVPMMDDSKIVGRRERETCTKNISWLKGRNSWGFW